MSAHQITLAELRQIVRNLFIGRMCSAAAITLVMYDWFLVFQREYDTIYQSRWSLPKALLLYIRVFTPPCLAFSALTLADFRPALSAKTYDQPSVPILVKLSDVFSLGLLSLRLIALYRRRRALVWFIIAFYLASYVTAFAVLSTLYYADAVKSCAAGAQSVHSMAAVFYAPAAFEAFVFSMTAYSAVIDSKVITGTSAPFLIVLYRDGMIAFLVMVGLRIWNCWIYITQPVSSYNMGISLMWAANAVLTTRIYVNLVWLAKKTLCTVPGSTMITGNSVRFQRQPDSTLDTIKESGLGTGHELGTINTIPELRTQARERRDWT
ncbi:hypothetical protein FRC17_009203 [Serendipita sp. 399]|nr:hypothetical protein FRC17_009203 [Serendipita sp. 399]